MTAAWVLSEEQCTIRSKEYNRSFSLTYSILFCFRFGKNPGKCGRKRRASQTSGSHSAEQEEDQNNRQMSQQHQEKRLEPPLWGIWITFHYHFGFHYQDQVWPMLSCVNVTCSFPRYFLTKEDMQQVAHIGSLYEASKEMISFSENNHALWEKIFGKEEKHAYSANEISSLVSTLIKKNIFFIESNYFFKQLPPGDQHGLLSKNMTEMCHLRGALRCKQTFYDLICSINLNLFSLDLIRARVASNGTSTTRIKKMPRRSRTRASQWATSPTSTAPLRRPRILSPTLRGLSRLNCRLRYIKGSIQIHWTETNGKSKSSQCISTTQVILLMMHVVVFSGDGVNLSKPELASAAQVHYLSLIQRWNSITRMLFLKEIFLSDPNSHIVMGPRIG